MSDQWVHLPEVADELCNYRGCFAESLNHPSSFHMNTGSRLGGDPALGAWAKYGLGSVNQIWGYVVMTVGTSRQFQKLVKWLFTDNIRVQTVDCPHSRPTWSETRQEPPAKSTR